MRGSGLVVSVRGVGRERGQASPEWLGLVLLVAVALATLLAAGVKVPGLDLGRLIAARIACAVGLGDGCERGGELAAAYGVELAALVSRYAPRLDYEDGMRALPVDFRSCREDACAEGLPSGAVRASSAGERVTAFVHVIDCRSAAAAPGDAYHCSAERAGHVYLQYWLYYPGSATGEGTIAPGLVREATQLVGMPSYHPDDWESFQVRIDSRGSARARASSHHGYNASNGTVIEPAWGTRVARYLISGGSHAGTVGASRAEAQRWTPREWIRLIPLEPLLRAGELDGYEFAVTPPWRKHVYSDPESRGTG